MYKDIEQDSVGVTTSWHNPLQVRRKFVYGVRNHTIFLTFYNSLGKVAVINGTEEVRSFDASSCWFG
jgi:hypothetical protein